MNLEQMLDDLEWLITNLKGLEFTLKYINKNLKGVQSTLDSLSKEMETNNLRHGFITNYLDYLDDAGYDIQVSRNFIDDLSESLKELIVKNKE